MLNRKENLAQIFQGEMPHRTWDGGVVRVATKPPYCLLLDRCAACFPQYDKPCAVRVPDQLERLQENVDVAVSHAERLYYNCHFRECFNVTSR